MKIIWIILIVVIIVAITVINKDRNENMKKNVSKLIFNYQAKNG